METGKRKGSSLHKGSQAEDSETAMVDTGTAGEERERHGGCTQRGASWAVGAGVRTGDVLCRGRGPSVRQTADAHSGEQRGFAEQGKHRNKGLKRPGRSFPALRPPPAACASQVLLSSVYFEMSPRLLHPLLPLQTLDRG